MQPTELISSKRLDHMLGFRVLLVEDDFILNQVLSDHLRECGFSVESVYCGAAAFEAIDENRETR